MASNPDIQKWMEEEPKGPRPYDLWITSGGNTRKFKKLLETHGFIPKPEGHSIVDYSWTTNDKSLKLTFATGDQIFLRVTRLTRIKKKVIKRAAKK